MKNIRRPMAAVLGLAVLAGAWAQTRGLTIKSAGGSAIGNFKGSYALVIGNSRYSSGWPKLPGVETDVDEVAALLGESGFQVEVKRDLGMEAMKTAYEDFIDAYGLDPENRLLFYYAGHGYTMKFADGRDMGYIVPIDAPNPNNDNKGFVRKAVEMQLFDTWAKRIQSRHALFLFDSCFSGSIFNVTRAVPANITEKTLKPVRQFITSGSADEEVPDKSVFRAQFVEALRGDADRNSDGYVTGAELGEFLDETVVNYTHSSQHPQYGKIQDPKLDKGDFVFEVKSQSSAKQPDTPPVQSQTPAAAAPERAANNMVKIPGGIFTMGSPASEPQRYSNEVQHQVTVGTFYLGAYEVTQAEWQAVMGWWNPSIFKGDKLPVEQVSWYYALVYCNKRSIKEGLKPAYKIKNATDPAVWGAVPTSTDASWDAVTCDFTANGYRLPTEAEWEYACRAGTTTPFSTGNNVTTSQANYDGNNPYNGNVTGEYRNKTTPAGSFAPNGYGVYDMHGNVWEWCWDWDGAYATGSQTNPTGVNSGTSRILRGGSWLRGGGSLRSAVRFNGTPSSRSDGSVGFRIAVSAR